MSYNPGTFFGDIALPHEAGFGIKVDVDYPTFTWRDLLATIETRPAGSAGATAIPDFVVYRGGVFQYRFGTVAPNNHLHEAFLNYHLPHDYVPNSDIFIHAHWSQIVVDTGGGGGVPGNAKWYFDISYADGHGAAGGTADPFSAPITVSVVQQGSTTQYGHMIAEVQFSNNGGTGGLLDSTSLQIDGVFCVRIYRDPTDGSDTLNQNTFVHYVDMHYLSTNIGTKQKSPNFYASGPYILPGLGSLSTSGAASNIANTSNKTVTASLGALTLAGAALNVLIPALITPSLGAVTLAGAAPDVLIPAIITPSLGTVSLAGAVSTVDQTVPPEITPTIGALTLAGAASTVTQALTFDAASSTIDEGGDTTVTWSHTCSGGNRALIVCIAHNGPSGGHSVSGVTYNSVAMTSIGGVSFYDDITPNFRVEQWKLSNPASGANDVQITLSNSMSVTAGAVSFTGAHQTTGSLTGTQASAVNHDASSNTPSVNVSSATGEIVVDSCMSVALPNPCAFTVGALQTSRWERGEDEGDTGYNGACSTEPGGTTITMSWTLANNALWGIVGVSVKPP